MGSSRYLVAFCNPITTHCFQLVTFQVPLTFILAHGVDHNFQYRILNTQKRKTICGHIGLHLPFLLIFGIQVQMAYLFWLAYGTLAFILGPLRTWSLVLAAVLWYNAIYLPEKCTRWVGGNNILFLLKSVLGKLLTCSKSCR